nr:MAG TPA: hypothetical protein [Caudoviricetes sp.]DAX20073.1 MAG TPA: hypothetical protein [Caudoviricetes sp.]DAY41162.1 MAG TPA: hypothetical protein [Bacteriophage sp.]
MSRQVNGQTTCLLFFLLINLYTFRKELKTKYWRWTDKL